MKKIIFVLIFVFGIFLTGCEKNNKKSGIDDEDVKISKGGGIFGKVENKDKKEESKGNVEEKTKNNVVYGGEKKLEEGKSDKINTESENNSGNRGLWFFNNRSNSGNIKIPYLGKVLVKVGEDGKMLDNTLSYIMYKNGDDFTLKGLMSYNRTFSMNSMYIAYTKYYNLNKKDFLTKVNEAKKNLTNNMKINIFNNQSIVVYKQNLTGNTKRLVSTEMFKLLDGFVSDDTSMAFVCINGNKRCFFDGPVKDFIGPIKDSVKKGYDLSNIIDYILYSFSIKDNKYNYFKIKIKLIESVEKVFKSNLKRVICDEFSKGDKRIICNINVSQNELNLTLKYDKTDFQIAKGKLRDEYRKSQLGNITAALTIYEADNGDFPEGNVDNIVGVLIKKGYLEDKDFRDPIAKKHYFYRRFYNNTGTGYILGAQMDISENCNIGVYSESELNNFIDKNINNIQKMKEFIGGNNKNYKKGCYYVRFNFYERYNYDEETAY